MKRRITNLALALLSATLWAGPAKSDDWPQWQGPDRNAISKETGLLQEWPKQGPPLAWRITGLGGGDGAPAISKGCIYVVGTRADEEVVRALTEKDGHELWTRPIGEKYQQRMPQSQEGPGCTPTVDGDLLYVESMAGSVACLKTGDGHIVWQRSLTKDFGGQVPTWSYRESPLVDGEKVICTPGGPDALLVALNKKDGQTIWKSSLPKAGGDEATASRPPGRGGRGRSGGAAYSSPIVIEAEGQRQYVQLTAKSLVGVAADDGKILWQYKAPANNNGINCSTPIFRDGLVFAASAYGAGGGAVKLEKDADGKFTAKEVYFSKRMQNHHGGMVVSDGALYGADGGNGGGNLICLDFQTGDVLWDQRGNREVAKGSIALADGRIYYRLEDGPMLLIEPNKKEYLQRGRFSQPDRSRSPAWSHPVIANGKLYIRDQDLLLCYDVRQK